MKYRVHICSFEACDLPRKRKLTYAAFTKAVIKAGRFSVFEATATQKIARLFTRMSKDERYVFTPLQSRGRKWRRERGCCVPIFEYQCQNGHTTEVIDVKREFVETPSIVCSQCGQVAMKAASAANFGGFPPPKESKISAAIRRVKARGL